MQHLIGNSSQPSSPTHSDVDDVGLSDSESSSSSSEDESDSPKVSAAMQLVLKARQQQRRIQEARLKAMQDERLSDTETETSEVGETDDEDEQPDRLSISVTAPESEPESEAAAPYSNLPKGWGSPKPAFTAMVVETDTTWDDSAVPSREEGSTEQPPAPLAVPSPAPSPMSGRRMSAFSTMRADQMKALNDQRNRRASLVDRIASLHTAQEDAEAEKEESSSSSSDSEPEELIVASTPRSARSSTRNSKRNTFSGALTIDALKRFDKKSPKAKKSQAQKPPPAKSLQVNVSPANKPKKKKRTSTNSAPVSPQPEHHTSYKKHLELQEQAKFKEKQKREQAEQRRLEKQEREREAEAKAEREKHRLQREREKALLRKHKTELARIARFRKEQEELEKARLEKSKNEADLKRARAQEGMDRRNQILRERAEVRRRAMASQTLNRLMSPSNGSHQRAEDSQAANGKTKTVTTRAQHSERQTVLKEVLARDEERQRKKQHRQELKTQQAAVDNGRKQQEAEKLRRKRDKILAMREKKMRQNEVEHAHALVRPEQQQYMFVHTEKGAIPVMETELENGGRAHSPLRFTHAPITATATSPMAGQAPITASQPGMINQALMREILSVDVTHRGATVGHIAVCNGDIPLALAQEFCQKHGLKAAWYMPLGKLVVDRVRQQAQKRGLERLLAQIADIRLAVKTPLSLTKAEITRFQR